MQELEYYFEHLHGRKNHTEGAISRLNTIEGDQGQEIVDVDVHVFDYKTDINEDGDNWTEYLHDAIELGITKNIT